MRLEFPVKQNREMVEAGGDSFAFRARFGHDVITDFQAGAGSDDAIEFYDGILADLADVLAHATEAGADTVIKLDAATSVTLQKVSPASLHADDSRFVWVGGAWGAGCHDLAMHARNWTGDGHSSLLDLRETNCGCAAFRHEHAPVDIGCYCGRGRHCPLMGPS